MQFFPLHKQVLAKYPSPARALLAVMLCMSEQPHLPRHLHALPSKRQRRSFLKLNKLGRGIFAAPLHLCSEQLTAQPQPGLCTLPSLLIFRTVIQLFVINWICLEVVSAGNATPSRGQGCSATSGTRCLRLHEGCRETCQRHTPSHGI